jgi:septal ring factor EnvC (AmiA/AmiB activator)
MPNIKKEIESLKAKIARLEKEQERVEKEVQTLNQASEEIDHILKEQGISFENYIGHHLKKVSRIVHKLEEPEENEPGKTVTKGNLKKKVTRKKKIRSKPLLTVKIPAGTYTSLPEQPEKVFEVKEKGPRPKALKAYAEQIGLEAFLEQCRIS